MEKKVALVTGGTGGIGYEIVKQLSNNNYTVLFTYANNQNKAKEMEKEFEDVHAVKYLASTDFQTVSEIIENIKEQHGRIDLLVNNLGKTNDKLLLKMSDDDFIDIINSNLLSVFNFSKAALKVMSKQKSGKIINISSVIAVTGNIGQSNYAASKAAMIGFSKSIAKEYARKQITVNCISPGFIETNMTDSLSDQIKADVLDKIPMKRFGKAKEVAELVVFLGSDKANYITGQNMIIDGGMI